MGSWIEATKKGINQFVPELQDVVPGARFGLVPYKDYSDGAACVVVHPFTTDVKVVKTAVDRMHASGGGDAPEAVGRGLMATLEDLKWNPDAVKVCVIIADAPPHGLGCQCCSGDSMPKGEPDGRDPIAVAHLMRRAGIRIFSIGCGIRCATCIAFYSGIAELTGGMYMPMSDAGQLIPQITAGVRQELDLAGLHKRITDLHAAIKLARPTSTDAQAANDIAAQLHAEGVTIHNVTAANAKAFDGIVTMVGTLVEAKEEFKFAQANASKTSAPIVAPPVAGGGGSGKTRDICAFDVLRVLNQQKNAAKRLGIVRPAGVNVEAGRRLATPTTQLARALRAGLGARVAKTPEKAKLDFIKFVKEMIAKGIHVVPTIVAIATSPAPPKPEASLLALAIAIHKSSGMPHQKHAADALLRVARTPTHLFEFSRFYVVDLKGGWGRCFRTAISNWYIHNKSARALAGAVTKMWSRHEFNHRDVVKLSHPKPKEATPAVGAVLQYIAWRGKKTRGDAPQLYPVEEVRERALLPPVAEVVEEAEAEFGWDIVSGEGEDGAASAPAIPAVPDPAVAVDKLKRFFAAVELAKDVPNDAEGERLLVALIERYGLDREHVPTEMLSRPAVWLALLKRMGPTAVLRNLNKMTTLDLFLNEATEASVLVLATLKDNAKLAAAHVNPLDIFIATETYAAGKGTLGTLTWTPVPWLVCALELSFVDFTCYLGAHQPPSTADNRVLIGIDLRASMLTQVGSTTARKAAAAFAKVAKTLNPHWEIVAFGVEGCIPFDLPPEATMMDYVKFMDAQPPRSMATLTSLLVHASMDENPKKFNAVVAFTASGTQRTFDDTLEDELSMYRQIAGVPNAIAVSVVMSADGTTSECKDAGVLDMVFSAQILAEITSEVEFANETVVV